MDKNIIEGDVSDFRRFADARCLLECSHHHTHECEARKNIINLVMELSAENAMLVDTIRGQDKQIAELRKKKK